MKKKVLQVVSSLSAGGAETMIMNINKTVDQRKVQFDFLIFGSDDFYSNEVLELGGRIIKIQPIRNTGIIKYMINLIKIIKMNGPYDVVHSHIDYLSGLVALAARIAGVKKRICHSHNSQALTYQGRLSSIQTFIMQQLIHHNATELYACGNKAALFMFGKRNVKKTKIINNSINLEVFCSPLSHVDRERLFFEIGISSSAKIIGSIGRFVEQKNHKRIIDIFSSLNTKNPEYELILVGEGELRKEIENYAQNKGLNNKVHFLGLRKDVFNIIKLFDVFLLPSYFEGFPVTLVEAQAAGIPSVISDNITKEVDLGIDLISFVSLDDNNSSWVKSIEAAKKRKTIDLQKSREASRENGFDINANIDAIYRAYGIN